MFKLNRMGEITRLEQKFQLREVPAPDLAILKLYPSNIEVKAIGDASMKWRLIEEFGPYCYEESEEGKLLFHGFYSD